MRSARLQQRGHPERSEGPRDYSLHIFFAVQTAPLQSRAPSLALGMTE